MADCVGKCRLLPPEYPVGQDVVIGKGTAQQIFAHVVAVYLELGVDAHDIADKIEIAERDPRFKRIYGNAAQDIRNTIAFIEKEMGVKWDWEAYFECAKRVNKITRNRLAWLEVNSTPYPQFVGAVFSLYNCTNYMGNCGRI